MQLFSFFHSMHFEFDAFSKLSPLEILNCTKDIFPSSGLWQRRDKDETGSPLLAAAGTTKLASRDQCFAIRSAAKML